MRWSALLLAGLLGCGTPAPAPAPAPETASETPTTSPAPTPSAAWPDSPGLHAVATISAFRKAPRRVAGDRAGLRLAILGERGRRIAFLAPGRAPSLVKLPIDLDGRDLAWDGDLVVVADHGRKVLAWVDDAGKVVRQEPVTDGRIRPRSRPDGALIRVDQLDRPYLEAEPAWRGVPAPNDLMVRATNNKAGPLLQIVGPDGDRRRALLASIPKARKPLVFGMEPVSDPLQGWMAVWSDAKEGGEELHVVRFDGSGRVLHTERVPNTAMFSVVAADRVALAHPTDGGLQVDLLVPPSQEAPSSSP